ncbi:hypothetical protein LCGC14_2193340 [marine sediment metagenome]|uniref:Uncharacterized protein n=1 Tax=marine sediment metagenome TaxID=412755 RepID=A0A0F9DIZ5_9ZZZZ
MIEIIEIERNSGYTKTEHVYISEEYMVWDWDKDKYVPYKAVVLEHTHYIEDNENRKGNLAEKSFDRPLASKSTKNNGRYRKKLSPFLKHSFCF